MENCFKFLIFSIKILYPPCISCSDLPPSLPLYISLSLGHCTLFCVGNSAGPRWGRNPSPGHKDSPAGDKKSAKTQKTIQVPEVFIPVEWRREQRKAKAGPGTSFPMPQKLCFLSPLSSQDHLFFPASLLSPSSCDQFSRYF